VHHVGVLYDNFNVLITTVFTLCALVG